MKHIFLLIALLASVSNCHAQAIIVISEVHPTGSSSGTYNEDWFELTNLGNAPINITGWRMDDSTGAFNLSAELIGVSVINPGQSVVFMETGSPATSFQEFTDAWFGPTVPGTFTIGSYDGSGVGLSSLGDGVFIFDSVGNIVTQVSFGAAVLGTTFDNAAGLSGGIGQLSQVGINGAFLSFNGQEIGSPGTIGISVPEPSSILLLGLTGMVALRYARKHGASKPSATVEKSPEEPSTAVVTD